MFAGIIEKTGQVLEVISKSGSKRFKIGYGSEEPLQAGESINLNGACQTVIQAGKDYFWVEAMQETLLRANLNSIKVRDEVNLERSLKLSDKVSGHLVSGHIDTIGSVSKVVKNPDSWLLKIKFSPEFSKYVAPKGSIALDGISLTVIEAGPDYFTAGIIPHTWQSTNLNNVRPGHQINLEFDLLAKYVESILKQSEKAEKITPEFLQLAGW